jgi:hypothetical protein
LPVVVVAVIALLVLVVEPEGIGQARGLPVAVLVLNPNLPYLHPLTIRLQLEQVEQPLLTELIQFLQALLQALAVLVVKKMLMEIPAVLAVVVVLALASRDRGLLIKVLTVVQVE